MPWEINSFGPKWNISLSCFISLSIHINIIAFNWIVFVIRVSKGGNLSKEIDCKANFWDSTWGTSFQLLPQGKMASEIQPQGSPDNSFLLTVESTIFMIKAHTPTCMKHFVSIQMHVLKSRVFFFFFFLFVVDFVIHWNETAKGLHVFPIPIPPPTSLSTH